VLVVLSLRKISGPTLPHTRYALVSSNPHAAGSAFYVERVRPLLIAS